MYHVCVNVDHIFDEPLITYINVIVAMVICNILVMWSFLVIYEFLTLRYTYILAPRLQFAERLRHDEKCILQ